MSKQKNQSWAQLAPPMFRRLGALDLQKKRDKRKKKEQDKTLVDSTSAKIVLEQWLLERNVNE